MTYETTTWLIKKKYQIKCYYLTLLTTTAHIAEGGSRLDTHRKDMERGNRINYTESWYVPLFVNLLEQSGGSLGGMGSVGLIWQNIRFMRISIPLDLSSRSFLPIPCFIHSRSWIHSPCVSRWHFYTLGFRPFSSAAKTQTISSSVNPIETPTCMYCRFSRFTYIVQYWDFETYSCSHHRELHRQFPRTTTSW
jgi:hypothetical protein